MQYAQSSTKCDCLNSPLCSANGDYIASANSTGIWIHQLSSQTNIAKTKFDSPNYAIFNITCYFPYVVTLDKKSDRVFCNLWQVKKKRQKLNF